MGFTNDVNYHYSLIPDGKAVAPNRHQKMRHERILRDFLNRAIMYWSHPLYCAHLNEIRNRIYKICILMSIID